ncbi:hypothetical protein CTAYLR_000521 [Chrysophaeum taylorii]|uniref:Chorein N-terminal domain-containing protein n=1 Tax=Chrysophaeum taylorii TaxID=2483200 RepID=A0AAD7UGV0_9STRA|nr:hypothetical protein CTAYLR_000521 [Chrysophaeum taylorii]
MVLSYLLEKFVRRLCGRWLRDFSADKVSISLGGTIELSDLRLDTNELSRMLLPLDPISGHCGSLVITLPLTGELVVRIEDIHVVLRTQEYACDVETARRAVEIAINLYWTNYLRSPQTMDNPPKEILEGPSSGLADTILALAKSSRLEVRKVHVRVESRSNERFVGDGVGSDVVTDLRIAEITVGGDESPPKKTAAVVKKILDVSGVEVECAGKKGFECGSARARFALDLSNVAGAIAELPPVSMLEEEEEEEEGSSGLLLPWVSKADVDLSVNGLKISLFPEFLSVILDCSARLLSGHRRRQDAARSQTFFAQEEDPRFSEAPKKRHFWGLVAGKVLGDIERRKGRWRRWFGEWRRAARYVAIRKLLRSQIKCGIFRHTSGELYYELNETCCVTRQGKFYAYPDQLGDERARARELVKRRLFNSSSAVVDAALSSWRQMKGGDDHRLEPRVAVALYAEQLWYDSVMEVPRAAALRALARRHLKCEKRTAAMNFARAYTNLDDPLLLVAPLEVCNVSTDILSDVRLEVGSKRTGKGATVDDDDNRVVVYSSSSGEDLELPFSEKLTISVVDVGVSGAYESTLASASNVAIREGLLELDVPRNSVLFDASAIRVRLAIRKCTGRDIHRARKILKKYKRLTTTKKSTKSTTRACVVSAVATFVDVDVDGAGICGLKASRIETERAVVSVPGAAVDKPAGTGEGSLFFAMSRLAQHLLAPASKNPVLWRGESSLLLGDKSYEIQVVRSCDSPGSRRLWGALAPNGRDFIIRAAETETETAAAAAKSVVDWRGPMPGAFVTPSRDFYFDSRCIDVGPLEVSILVSDAHKINATRTPPLYSLMLSGPPPDDDSFEFLLEDEVLAAVKRVESREQQQQTTALKKTDAPPAPKETPNDEPQILNPKKTPPPQYQEHHDQQPPHVEVAGTGGCRCAIQ